MLVASHSISPPTIRAFLVVGDHSAIADAPALASRGLHLLVAVLAHYNLKLEPVMGIEPIHLSITNGVLSHLARPACNLWCFQQESNLQLVITNDLLYHLTMEALSLCFIYTQSFLSGQYLLFEP